MGMKREAFRSVLIFGGAGFIGSNWAQRLLETTEAKVHVFDNLSRSGVAPQPGVPAKDRGEVGTLADHDRGYTGASESAAGGEARDGDLSTLRRK